MNKLAIVVPFHRLIGVSGQLVGYGGGLWRKKRLHELERQHAAKQSNIGIQASLFGV